METITVVIIDLLLLIAALLLGIPVAAALGLAGLLGCVALSANLITGLGISAFQTMSTITSYSLTVVPMFVLMGELASLTGISQDLFDAAYRVLGRLPGGLAVATTYACAGFAAVTGSSLSECVAMGRICLPEMRKHGYSDDLSIGTIASAATFAMMIPPSIMLVVYAVFAEQSIGKLLIAGILPGLVTAVVYSIMIVTRTRLNPKLGPRGPSFLWKEKLDSLSKVTPFLLILAGILGGILFGVWTPVEAGSGGVLLVLTIGFIRTKSGKIYWSNIISSLRRTILTTAMIMLITVGALIYGKFLALSGVAEMLAEKVTQLSLSPGLVYVILILLYLFLGCFLEGISMMALTIPIVLPLIVAMGWNTIWFGIVVVKLVEVAQITPPVGINLFAMKAVAPEVPMSTILKGVWPFYICELAVLALLYFLPQMALSLPEIMSTGR